VHVLDDPLQISNVQLFASLVHGVFAGLNWFAGQLRPVPSHTSAATSHSPATGRQTVPAAFGPTPHTPPMQVAWAHSWEVGGAGQVAAVVHGSGGSGADGAGLAASMQTPP
jgi:hypothetical protein